MTSLTKLPSGVPGLDTLTRGGLPQGRATLVAGRSGAGKSILSLQIACALADAGHRVLYLAVEETPSDLIDVGDTLGFETTVLMKRESLRLIDLIQPLRGPVFVSGTFDLNGLRSRIEHEASEARATVIVIDSLSALFAPVPGNGSARHQLFQMLYWMQQSEYTFVGTVESPADYGQVAALGFEDYLCDLFLVLRNLIDDKRRRRTIEVHKYRRSGHYKGEYSFALTRSGVSIFPLDAEPPAFSSADFAGNAYEAAPAERYPSGIDGLDRITGGGWLRDSIVLVRGPTGSGKTILASMYAIAGAKRGERVFYYGFEETAPILVRNLETLGMDVRPVIEDGSLKIIARYPEATSPEDMIIELRTILNEYQPSLIVLDSISAIEHVLSYESFRQFVIGITSALRSHGRSALCTQATQGQSARDDGAPYLSTLADAILSLSYAPSEEGLGRRIRVLKMRGSDHAAGESELRIQTGGIVVDSLNDETSKR